MQLIRRSIACAVLVLTAAVSAQTFKPFRVNPVPGGATYPDIRFWLNFEDNDTTGDYNMGGSECSAGDTSGAYASSSTILSTHPKVGSYYLGASSPDGNDYMTFVVSSDDIMSGTDGRIGLWFYMSSWQTGTIIIDGNFTTDANNYFFVREQTNTTNELSFRWRQGGTNEIDVTSTTANLSTATWYFLEVEYDTTANVLRVYVNGTAVITDTSTNTTAISTLSTFHVGYGENGNVEVDNLMISNDPSRDFYSNGTSDLSVATTKPSGACS